MKITATTRGYELSRNEWNDISKTTAFLRFRRNAITVRFEAKVRFHDEIYEAQRQVAEYLHVHATGLWFMEGASNDGYRTLYLESHRDAVNFRLRWHDTDV
jgi:hypothetical protein